MRALTVDVNESAGRMLCCSIFRPGGRKILGKGHLLNAEDVRMLATEGMSEVWVTELEDGEVGEDEAVFAVANAMCCGSAQIKLAAGGRANVLATEPSCALVDEELLKEINRTSGVVIATSSNFRYVSKDDRMATVKSAPFAVSRGHLDAILKLLSDRGQILQARPIRDAKVNVLYTDPVQGERARLMFEGAVKSRLDGLKAQLGYSIASVEEEDRSFAPCIICCAADQRQFWWHPARHQRVRKMSLDVRSLGLAPSWSAFWLPWTPVPCFCWATRATRPSCQRLAVSAR